MLSKFHDMCIVLLLTKRLDPYWGVFILALLCVRKTIHILFTFVSVTVTQTIALWPYHYYNHRSNKYKCKGSHHDSMEASMIGCIHGGFSSMSQNRRNKAYYNLLLNHLSQFSFGSQWLPWDIFRFTAFWLYNFPRDVRDFFLEHFLRTKWSFLEHSASFQ